MKRTLLFLLLFGSSLAFVLWLERRDSPTPTPETASEEPSDPQTSADGDPAASATDPTPSGGTDPTASGPTTPESPEQPEGTRTTSQIQPGARFEVRGYAGSEAGAAPVRFEVEARDSRLADADTWELIDVTAEKSPAADAQALDAELQAILDEALEAEAEE